MKTSVDIRFGLFTLWMTGLCVSAAVSFFYDVPVLFMFFCLLFPWIRNLLGPDYKGWYERDREVSNRTLIIGFSVCLAAVWIGGIALAHYISPQRHTPKYVIWTAAALLWMVYVLPAYRWWRAQKGKVDA